MIRILVCDDEPVILTELRNYIAGCLAGLPVEIGLRDDPNRLLDEMKEDRYDMILLDIDMPRISGMDIAGELMRLKSKAVLIFVTNQESFVYDAFQYKPFDFIRKSRYKEDLGKTLLRACGELALKNERFVFKTAAGAVKLAYGDIQYFESLKNYLKVVTKTEAYQYRGTMQTLEHQLNGKGFIRIHKGFLVNQAYIYMVCADKILLEGGAELPIGRAYSESAKAQVMKYLR